MVYLQKRSTEAFYNRRDLGLTLMQHENEHQQLISCVEELKEDKALETVHGLLEVGEDAMRIIDSCQMGMRLVGERYHRRQYYIAGLIMAGEILRQVVEIVQPQLIKRSPAKSTGTLLLGTVEGDIHDLGKDIFKILLECYGFVVVDLGVDVPAADFLSQAIIVKPHIIGISALLTGVFGNLQSTIAVLRADKQLRAARIPIIIGGAQINQKVSEEVQADYWTTDAIEGVNICQKLMGRDLA
jgi:methanogenic corrinoid protein MtbC1